MLLDILFAYAIFVIGAGMVIAFGAFIGRNK